MSPHQYISMRASAKAPSYPHHDACGVSTAIKEGAPSHEFLQEALDCSQQLDHRGGADDGIGIATSQPIQWILNRNHQKEFQHPKHAAAGMLFFSRQLRSEQHRKILDFINSAAENFGLRIVGFEEAPFTAEELSPAAQATAPVPYYLYFEPHNPKLSLDTTHFEYEKNVSLFQQFIEHRIEAAIKKEGHPEDSLRIISLSPFTLIHKGMGTSADLKRTWPSLSEEDFEVSWYALHRRFSTNTFPQWWLAQPFFMLLHNGEINTIIKNRSTAGHLEKNLQQARKYAKILTDGGSDSADMDRVLQQRYMAFRSFYKASVALLVALETLIPPAYRSPFAQIKQDFAEFIQFHRRHLGGGAFFGGPAFCIAFTRDTIVGKVDNMALRPAKWAEKWWIDPNSGERERIFTASSEFGALHGGYSEDLIDAGILGPGDIICASRDGVLQVMKAEGCRDLILAETHYKNSYHVTQKMDIRLSQLNPPPYTAENLNPAEILTLQRGAGWQQEHIDNLHAMCATGKLPVSAMGTPWPMAAFRDPIAPVYDMAQQRFAQVTNPPIDSIREGDKINMVSRLGGRDYNPNSYTKEPKEQISVPSPILTNEEIHQLKEQEHFQTTVIDCSIEVERCQYGSDLQKELEAIADTAVKAVVAGTRNLILSHRPSRNNRNTPLEMPLILGAILSKLNEYNLRQNTSLIIESDDIKEAHDAALLIAMGANAVNPALAEDSISEGVSYMPTFSQEETELEENIPRFVGKRLKKADAAEHEVHVDGKTARKNLNKALTVGLKKIMGKMGINDIDGYRGSGLFEVIGLGPQVQQYLSRLTPSRIGGQDLGDRLEYLRQRQRFAETGVTPQYAKLPNAWKQRSAELRTPGVQSLLIPQLKKIMNDPDIQNLNILDDGVENIPLESLQKIFDSLSELRRVIGCGENSERFQIRELFDVEGIDSEALQNAQVTEADLQMAINQIIPTIKAGHMSFGALLKWAKEAIEMGLNAIGTYGGSGEGGIPHSMIEASKPKAVQVASGRFGVTAEYLAQPRIEEICIKMAQGAKPGEGGQLPSFKVSLDIAQNRHCEPNTELISPPPHHDIYSIEELLQLIEDLKCVNPNAKIAVKLVAGTGIGTIAAGVVKAGADTIEIDGYEGGTGARSFESHHAGLPTEYGIREVHQTLVEHGLRDKVTVRGLGGIKSAQDMLKYKLMGADQVGCGTLAMVALNCNLQANCNVGCGIQIAHPLSSAKKLYQELETIMKDPEQYQTFVRSRAKQVALLFLGLALEQAVMTRMMNKHHQDLVGDTSRLIRKPPANEREQKIDTSDIIIMSSAERAFLERERQTHVHLPTAFPERTEWQLAKHCLQDETWSSGQIELRSDMDRSFGAYISGERVRNGTATPITLATSNNAGNSYAVWGSKGMTFIHRGSAEEGFAKGISEGCNVSLIRPNSFKELSRLRMPLISNNIGFGATGGQIFVDSLTGQRCGIRLSGKTQLFARGGSEYAAEYMTGGTITLLPDPRVAGSYDVVVGKFGSGMSGGQAFVFVKKGQDIQHHLDDTLEVRELDIHPESKSTFFAELESFIPRGLHPKELEYWKEHFNNEKGRVVCIRPKREQS